MAIINAAYSSNSIGGLSGSHSTTANNGRHKQYRSVERNYKKKKERKNLSSYYISTQLESWRVPLSDHWGASVTVVVYYFEFFACEKEVCKWKSSKYNSIVLLQIKSFPCIEGKTASSLSSAEWSGGWLPGKQTDSFFSIPFYSS